MFQQSSYSQDSGKVERRLRQYRPHMSVLALAPASAASQSYEHGHLSSGDSTLVLLEKNKNKHLSLLSNRSTAQLVAHFLSGAGGLLVPLGRTYEEVLLLTVTQQFCRFIKRQQCSPCHHERHGGAAPHRLHHLHPAEQPGAAAGQSLR